MIGRPPMPSMRGVCGLYWTCSMEMRSPLYPCGTGLGAAMCINFGSGRLQPSMRLFLIDGEARASRIIASPPTAKHR